MASIRLKLTGAYAGLLIGTVVAFGTAVYGARKASVYNELAQIAAEHGDIALSIIDAAARSGDTLITRTDVLIGPVISPRLRSLLDAVPEYVLVYDRTGRTIYGSPIVRALTGPEINVLTNAADSLSYPGPAIKTEIKRDSATLDEIILVERRPQSERLGVQRVVAGVSTRVIGARQRSIFVTLLVVAPLILAVSITGAHFISRRAFQPVDQIINEVEAITDGRSLHRRLPIDESGDELARLGTTLNAMISRLETSFGALRRFTADASHELKTPLTVLRADVERAMHTTIGSTEQLVALEEALQEITRMADLVDSLLTLARADEGRFDIHREEIELEPLCRDVFETAVILGEDAGLNVSMPVVENAVVLGDHMRLRQLFLNLVTNAIKYTPRGGIVELSLARRGGTVAFSVRDSGVGIAAADLPYIFERFWRADRVRTRRVSGGDRRWVDERGGFGLGLAISQWIAQAHGGSLTATSRLSRGSTFTVTLPIAEPEAQGDHAPEEPQATETTA